MIPANILIIEPDVRSREILEKNLAAQNIFSISCGRGREALKLVSSYRLNLVVLELNLPDISGLEVARRLRKTSATANLPILAYTAAWDITAFEQALGFALNGYLVKSSTSAGGLIEAIIGQLNLSARKLELRSYV